MKREIVSKRIECHASTDTTTDQGRPTKHFSLVCWRLLYGVTVQETLVRKHEIEACLHCRLDLVRWDALKTEFPREWAKLISKRQRRLEWLQKQGSVPDGWCPPDPADPRRTANKPIAAYLARRKLSLVEFDAKYARVPLRRKKGGKSPPWKMILRVSEWLA